VRLDNPFRPEHATPNAISADDTAEDVPRSHVRAERANMELIRPSASPRDRSTMILVSAVTALVVGLLFAAAAAALLFACGIIRT